MSSPGTIAPTRSVLTASAAVSRYAARGASHVRVFTAVPAPGDGRPGCGESTTGTSRFPALGWGTGGVPVLLPISLPLQVPSAGKVVPGHTCPAPRRGTEAGGRARARILPGEPPRIPGGKARTHAM